MGDNTERGGRLGRLLGRSTPDEPTGPPVDDLTGLPGRAELSGWAEAAVNRSAATSARAVVAFVDLTMLRDVNDSFGPDVGDRLLAESALRLRSIDMPGTEVARYGGAELAVVLPDVSHHEQAEEIARFLLELMHEPFDIGGEAISTTATVGVAISADSHSSADDVIRDAHQALVRARDEGAGSYVVLDDSRRGRYETRVDEDRLVDALKNDEFILHYQPIVRLDTHEMVGVEALLRWSSPSSTNSGVVYPHDFLPLLEKSGLAVPVGDWVLNEACNQLATWLALAPDRPSMFLSCNLGPRQLAEQNIADRVMAAVTASGIEPSQLALDLTDAALRYNRSSSWGSLRALKNAGVKLSLGDFGTGESGLLYLRELGLDMLRIDRVFVEGLRISLNAGLGADNPDGLIIHHIAALGRALGLVTIAEGVESSSEGGALREHGVDLGQGFHFGRPQGADHISAALAPDAQDDGRWDTSQVLKGG